MIPIAHALLAKIKVFAFQAVVSFSSNWPLMDTFVTKILLLYCFLFSLFLTWIPDFVDERNGLGRLDLEVIGLWFLSWIVRPWHLHNYFPKITIVMWAVVNLIIDIRSRPYPLLYIILSKLHHWMWTENPSITIALFAADLIRRVIKTEKARKSVIWFYLPQGVNFWKVAKQQRIIIFLVMHL